MGWEPRTDFLGVGDGGTEGEFLSAGSLKIKWRLLYPEGLKSKPCKMGPLLHLSYQHLLALIPAFGYCSQ